MRGKTVWVVTAVLSMSNRRFSFSLLLVTENVQKSLLQFLLGFKLLVFQFKVLIDLSLHLSNYSLSLWETVWFRGRNV